MKSELTLDVGCGFKAHGAPLTDVNCDIVKIKRWQNFVQCDARFLPFKSNCFSVVYCHHVLEHIEDYVKALKELLRVAIDVVEIKVPHRFSAFRQHPDHKHKFSVKTFVILLRGYRFHVALTYQNLLPFLVTPYEITVKLYKNG